MEIKCEQFGIADEHIVDRQDVIVADYDLLDYSKPSDTTGSSLSYLLRCFTQCRFIIVLNRYGTNAFDLRLVRQVEDFADLHIGSEQIGNPGLWGNELAGYRPWHWPVVPQAARNFEQCVLEVMSNPDAPILDFLGLTPVMDWLSTRAMDFLAGRQQRPEEVTFSSFAESGGDGITVKDKLIPEQAARVTTARISTLLNLIVVPEQNLLVDAPHLISRFPSLLKGRKDDLDMWNRVCDPAAGEVEDLLSDRLRERRFKKSHWLWRPAWYWPEVNRDEEIDEVKNPWNFHSPEWVFCENVSRFVPRDYVTSFKPDITPPFVNRYLFTGDESAGNLDIGQTKDGGPRDLSRIEYIPQVYFSL